MLYIGIDLGTSSVKLLLMDGAGRILNVVSREYPLSFPHPGWSEQDPADWLRETVAGVRRLTQNCDRGQIAGIGCGGQMHGLVALDKDDRVLRPAILWNDGRTAEETDYLNNKIGRDKLSAWTANIAFAGFTAPKLLWMRRHEPELFARIDKIMGFHCGNTPSCRLCANRAVKYQLIQHRLLEPKDSAPDFTRGTLEGDIAPSDITFYRLQCDSEGTLRAYIAQGEVLPVATRSFGGIGVFAIPEMGRFYRHGQVRSR